MVKQVLQILSIISFFFLFERCAQVGVLNGGKRDMTPPKLVESLPKNQSTNFKEHSIQLKFDEFVQIKDLSNQLIITPRLKNTPEISAEGKKVIIHLGKEELLPNTTYRFSFGKAIADMNESNSIPDFDYVFSTGVSIDTLELKGNVKDAFNNKPVGTVLVALYPLASVNDSAVYKNEPAYYTKSNDNGDFLLKYLPAKTFKAFCFNDKNKNNLYDRETEKVAFLDSSLSLQSDSSIHFRLFQEEASKSFVKKINSPYYGFTQILLNKKSKVRVAALNQREAANIHEINAGMLKDTVNIYYKNISDTLGLIFQNQSANKTDTLKISLPKTNAGKKRLRPYNVSIVGNKLAFHSNISYTFLNWMDTSKTDLSRIKLKSKEDSLIGTLPVKGHWRSINRFELAVKLKEGVNYVLKTDTAAFFDFGHFTSDSSTYNFSPQNKTEFGKLTLKLLFNLKQNYIVQLINDQETIVKEQFVSLSLSSSNAVTLDFNDVAPGIYFAKIVFDDNKNKKWDTGDLIRKQQPERVIINSKQLKVLSDWEIEEEIIIKD